MPQKIVLSNSEAESEKLSSTQDSPRVPPSSSDNIDNDDAWTDTDEDPVEILFAENLGVNTNLPSDALPTDYFCLFFDDSLFELVTNETNKWANVFYQSQRIRSSRGKLWKNVTVDEMKKFIGLCCLSGTVVFPLLAKQWSKHPIYFHPVFGCIMSRNRFQIILKMLRFANHDAFDPTDKIFKTRYFFLVCRCSLSRTLCSFMFQRLSHQKMKWRL